MSEQLVRGFARLSPEERQTIARMGGIAAHKKGTAHEFTRDKARAAGQVGGMKVSQDRNHMVLIGRRGGQATKKRFEQAVAGITQEERPAENLSIFEAS